MKLTIDNSECKIEGFSIQQYKELRDILSYTPDPNSYYMKGYGPKKITLLNKNGLFPTGLLYLVLQYLQKINVDFISNDIRRKPLTYRPLFELHSTITPYDAQKRAINEAVKYDRGIIVAPTGSGKSFMIAMLIDKLRVPTIVVVPNLELKRQLIENLSNLFGKDKVGLNKPIYVENIDGYNEKKCIFSYHCVIIDEFHHSAAKTYRKLNKTAWSSIYYKFGFTATPFRSQENERLLLESILSKVIYRISYNEAVSNGFIVPLEAYYIEIPKTKIHSSKWQEVYSNLIVNNHIRNEMIAKLLILLNSQKKSTLCLVKEVKHGEIIKEKIKGFFAHGENEDTPFLIQLFNKTKLKTLIGTTGVIGEGIDTKPCEFVIIAGLGKSKNAFMQQAGRSFRKFENKESAKVIIFLDKSHKFTREHYKAQCRYLLEEYGIIPEKLTL